MFDNFLGIQVSESKDINLKIRDDLDGRDQRCFYQLCEDVGFYSFQGFIECLVGGDMIRFVCFKYYFSCSEKEVGGGQAWVWLLRYWR